MGNLIEIQSQIEKLQKQAAEIKSREFDKTVKQILAMMEAFGITLKDLQPRKARGNAKMVGRKGRSSALAKKVAAEKAGRKPSGQKGAKAAAKYRGPNGETWSGRGLTPRWLAALVAQGRAKEDFAIKS